jgi:hypothetical protein
MKKLSFGDDEEEEEVVSINWKKKKRNPIALPVPVADEEEAKPSYDLASLKEQMIKQNLTIKKRLEKSAVVEDSSTSRIHDDPLLIQAARESRMAARTAETIAGQKTKAASDFISIVGFPVCRDSNSLKESGAEKKQAQSSDDEDGPCHTLSDDDDDIDMDGENQKNTISFNLKKDDGKREAEMAFLQTYYSSQLLNAN